MFKRQCITKNHFQVSHTTRVGSFTEHLFFFTLPYEKYKNQMYSQSKY